MMFGYGLYVLTLLSPPLPHITSTLISSALMSSELISSGVSTHMHVAAQQLLRSGVAEHTCVEEGGEGWAKLSQQV